MLVGMIAANANARDSPRAETPTTVHPRWHRLAGDVMNVAVGPTDLALTSSRSGPGDLSLLDRRTGGRTALTAPDCPDGARIVGFGGSWLATQCELADGSEEVDLDDLASGTWTQHPLAPDTCNVEATVCAADAVGTTWIRFFETEPEGCENHCASIGYLQNISTGAIEPDPADNARADVVDSLDSPTGVAPPRCPKPPGSAFSVTGDSSSASTSWQQLNGFAFSVDFNPAIGEENDTLYRCGSRHGLRVVRNALSSDTLASSSAILTQDAGPADETMDGLSLPALHDFVIPRPKGRLVALRGSTIYTIDAHSSLWSGAFRRPSS